MNISQLTAITHSYCKHVPAADIFLASHMSESQCNQKTDKGFVSIVKPHSVKLS